MYFFKGVKYFSTAEHFPMNNLELWSRDGVSRISCCDMEMFDVQLLVVAMTSSVHGRYIMTVKNVFCILCIIAGASQWHCWDAYLGTVAVGVSLSATGGDCTKASGSSPAITASTSSSRSASGCEGGRQASTDPFWVAAYGQGPEGNRLHTVTRVFVESDIPEAVC